MDWGGPAHRWSRDFSLFSIPASTPLFCTCLKGSSVEMPVEVSDPCRELRTPARNHRLSREGPDPVVGPPPAPSLGGRESPVSSPRGDGDALKTPGPGCGQDGEHGAHGPAPAVVSPPHKGRVGLSSQVGKISGDVWAALGTWKALQRQPIWLIKQG